MQAFSLAVKSEDGRDVIKGCFFSAYDMREATVPVHDKLAKYPSTVFQYFLFLHSPLVLFIFEFFKIYLFIYTCQLSLVENNLKTIWNVVVNALGRLITFAISCVLCSWNMLFCILNFVLWNLIVYIVLFYLKLLYLLFKNFK